MLIAIVLYEAFFHVRMPRILSTVGTLIAEPYSAGRDPAREAR